MEGSVAAVLSKIGVDDETIVEYIAGILSDEDVSEEDKRAAIEAYLTAVCEGGGDLSNVVEDLMTSLEAWKQAEKERKLAASVISLKLDDGKTESDTIRKREDMDASERRRRDKLLSNYGFTDRITSDGEIQFASGGDDLPSEFKNDNKTIALKIAQAQREKSQLEHEAKVKRDQEALKKEKERKEKEKQRTQKQEKQRGRG